ncbi:MAG TPA: lipid-A-disaccharide synthase [Pyrinomonadaceae bacterium]|nr:lipid-A-disaccharide synthase [Pyrinomonadaceae bacterium]
MTERLQLMIVAGEPSGDAHAAALVRALRLQAPAADLELFGATGAEMREAGVESIVASDDLAIMGILEVARVLPKFWRAFQALKRAAIKRRPDAVVLVDWPDFNLRLARALHREGLRVIYYISPQLWAWRAYRVRSLARDVDLLLSILPFEPEWYKQRGFHHVEFVGHPLVGEVHPRFGREEFCRRNDLDPARPIVALLPGSRHKELHRILPPMIEAAARLGHERPETQFVIALAPNRPRAEADALIQASARNNSHAALVLRVTQHETREALGAADAAAVASGTATLEAALIETPFVIVYKESFINWHTLGRLISAEHFGLINLIAGERLVTELMQDDLTGERLAEELTKLLESKQNEAARSRLREAAARLGTGGASERAARAVLNALHNWRIRSDEY